MLSVRQVSVRYGRSVQALSEVSLDVSDGSVVAVLGGNGAGKTTLLRAISGTLPLHNGAISHGQVLHNGVRIDRMDPAQIVRRRVLQVPEGRQIFTGMTVEDNLRAGGLASPARTRTAARDRVYELFPVLAERARQVGGLLSGGEQQQLAIGRALMASPDTLLLDEPSLGLAPQLVSRLGSIVQQINAAGTSVVLVEQNATMALGVAHWAVVLEVGHLTLEGSAEELVESDDIQQLYLGGHAESEAAAVAAATEAQDHRRRRPTLRAWSG
ncbi:ABC transporter ATP-binding protein [Amycolatopsis pithecellobii]|uniref:ATP-binding cassette domain-containing protein n=1 Tax=Amycolatopsis pithecellobii TaxID=664692 RepID=A0A6N7YMR4_9PSEU|nr:ABC transporter ATP-binding protein [Amycolatopsis pithecellobii]MTD53158.1 ATP-binding cassette domain-containing protein [Amycolatopsis pithecellobii]